MNNIEKTLEYHELLMTRPLKNIPQYELKDGFSFKFWDSDDCINDWVNIHIESGEFNSIEEAFNTFHTFYDKFYKEIKNRCFFIENENGEKIATATISPANEYGYECVVDWFAISSKAQGLGLSKPLLTKTLLTALNLKYKEILLHTQTHTWLAAKIYLDFGFEPLNTGNDKGWEILNTITNHSKLKNYKKLKSEEMYDNLILKIKNKLDVLHKDYNYSVWYINNRNDVYVREKNKFFKYKFLIENNEVKLIENK